jgi:YggT family protein
MHAFFHAFFEVLYQVLHLYMWCLIITAILSWLIAFDVVNRSNLAVYRIYDFFRRLTDPVLAPIRRVVPLIGGIDVSPIILYFILQFLMTWIAENYLMVPLYP